MVADICIKSEEILSEVISFLNEQDGDGDFLDTRMPLLIFFTNEALRKGQPSNQHNTWLEKLAFEFCISYFKKCNDSITNSVFQSCRKLLLLTSKSSYIAMKIVKNFMQSVNVDESNHKELEDINFDHYDNRLSLEFKVSMIHEILNVSMPEICDGELVTVKKDAVQLCVLLIKSEFISDSCFVIVCSLLKYLTKHGLKEDSEVLWETISNLHGSGNLKRLLILLAILLEVLAHSCLIKKGVIWVMLQEGLVYEDPLTRKRALYIIKWLLDHISKEEEFLTDLLECESPIMTWRKGIENDLWSVWKMVILLLETLEEKQMHVINPVLPLINEVSLASIKDSLLQWSWILVILRRALKHESKLLNKFALHFCLQMNMVLSKYDLDILFPELLQSLQSTYLYAKEETSCSGDPPIILDLLRKFISNCLRNCEENPSQFIQMILASLHSSPFNYISLIYFTEALSHQSGNIKLSENDLASFKQFLTSKIGIYRIEYQRVIFHNLSLFYINNMIPEQSNIATIINLLTYAIDNSFLVLHGNCWNSWLFWLMDMPDDCKKDCILQLIEEFLLQHVVLMKDHWISVSGFSYIFIMQCLMFPSLDIKSKTLQCLTDVTRKLHANPYLDDMKVLRVLALQNCLLKASINSNSGTVIDLVSFLVNNSTDILQYIMYAVEHLHDNNLYFEILGQCLTSLEYFVFFSSHSQFEEIEFSLKKFFDKFYIDILSNLLAVLNYFDEMMIADDILISKMYSIKLLSYYLTWVKENTNLSEILSIVENLIIKCNRQLLNNICKEADILQHMNCNVFICHLWSCLMSLHGKFDFNHLANHVENKNLLLESFFSDITIVSCVNVADVIQFCQHFIPLFKEDCYQLICICDCMLKLIKDQSQTDHSFWKIYENCICALFHEDLLNSSKEEVIKKVKEAWVFILEEGERKIGVVNILVAHCVRIWSTQEDPTESLFRYLDELISVSLFGPLINRNTKPKDDLIAYLHNVYKYDKVMELKSTHYYNQNVRVTLVNFLLNLKGTSNVRNFMNHFKVVLLDTAVKLSESKKCYYPNTLIHRKLLRAWQLFLVLLSRYFSFLNYDEILRKLFMSVKTAHQTSIRYLIEWAILLIIIHQMHNLSSIWEEMVELSEKKISSVTSMLSLVYHLARLLKGDDFVVFIQSAVPKVLPWAHAQHMTSRIHAQIALQTIWENIVESSCHSLIEQFSFLSYCIILENETSSIVKHRAQLMDCFFYSEFHPLNHYTLETIFHKFPAHMDLLSDEWVSTDHFLYNKDVEDDICQLLEKDNLSLPTRIKMHSENVQCDEKLVDLQKKIMPWRISPSVDDAILQSELDRKNESKASHLILCAVLIDKIPNLGGLCRTCEIFGVSTLVIGSHRYVEDKGFKSLSVSAERWLDIQQVLPIKLHSYLKEMRCDGYHIVGVEQTANSKMIGQYAFAQKTVLVLGNEKTGIPVDVIQLLDECVEIPQLGIIRSLNVHISGAIMIWEYCKQHMLDIS